VGQGQRAPEGVEPVEYRLGDVAATRRALAAAALVAAASLAPVVFAVVLLHRLGWGPNLAFWLVAGALGVLVVVRAHVSYAAMRRRLRTFVVTVSDDEIRVSTARDSCVTRIERSRVKRIVEIGGALGGIRVESSPHGGSEAAAVAQVPRGGARFADVRARLEAWRTIERRGRRGPAVRFAFGAAIVAAIFFAPFLLEDFVASSKVIAAGLVVGMWVVMRGALRPR
jgi:hypothetical protein